LTDTDLEKIRRRRRDRNRLGLRQWIVVFLTVCAGDQAGVAAHAWIIPVVGALISFGQVDGLDLLREIRSRSDVPIIITGDRRDEIDRVVGLELDADDYITEPFGLRELLARIRAVLRRQEAGRAAAQRDDPGRGCCCQFGGWRLDRRARQLTGPNGALVALTKSEYALLITFLDAPQRLLTPAAGDPRVRGRLRA
jgi:DNA-binding response OmpR family regulator